MIKRQVYLFLALITAFSGCIKETYNMNKLSEEIHYSPTFGMAVANGELTLSDILKPSDTVVYDADNFVRIIFREDSVINLQLEDFYDLSDMVTYNNEYTVGEIKIADFQATYGLTLREMSTTFSPALRTTFQGLDDGSPHNFPSFPATSMPDLSFAPFSNIAHAIFASGTLSITVSNNLPVSLNGITIRLLNSSDRSPVGGLITMTTIAPAASRVASINLAGVRVTSSIIAVVTQNGSPGSTSPVIVDLDNDINIRIATSLLRVQSGRVTIPSQIVETINNNDTIDFDPGSGVEVEKFRISTGNLYYTVTSRSQLRADLNITLPSTERLGVPVTETISITAPNSIKTGSISLNNTVIDLSKDPDQPYNRLPVVFAVTINSGGNMIDFTSTDNIDLDFNMQDPGIDYVKGYFGQLTESISPDSIDLGMDEVLDNLTGDFHISDPSITLNYSNSFGIPINIKLDAEGRNNGESVDLRLDTFAISHPTGLTTRDVTGSYVIDKDNSDLPDLLSLPPSVMSFSGTAAMNPLGMTAGRNNYVYGNSRFIGSLEVEVPLEFWINNLQFSDTVDNFLSTDDMDSEDFSPSDLNYTRLDITVNNGFPVGLSLKVALYDSVRHVVLKTVEATDFLKAAPVDANGKVNGSMESVTSIEFTPDFFDSANDADKIIFLFSLKTSGSGTQDVKIYSDYKISFSAAIVANPDINLK